MKRTFAEAMARIAVVITLSAAIRQYWMKK